MPGIFRLRLVILSLLILTGLVANAFGQTTIEIRPSAGSLQGLSLTERQAKLVEIANSTSSAADVEDFLGEWIAGIRAEDRLDALKFLQSAGLPEDITVDLVGRTVRGWADHDPSAAAAWANAMPAGNARQRALENVAISWAAQDFDKAANWALALPDGVGRSAAVLAVSNEGVRVRPQQALNMLAATSANAARDELIRAAAMELAVRNQSAVVDWAGRISNDALRIQVLSGIAIAMGKTDPEAAGTFAMQSLPSGRLRDDTLVGIAQRWAEIDPHKAAAWVATFPAGEFQQAAVESVASIWAQDNAPEAAIWRASFTAKR